MYFTNGSISFLAYETYAEKCWENWRNFCRVFELESDLAERMSDNTLKKSWSYNNDVTVKYLLTFYFQFVTITKSQYQCFCRKIFLPHSNLFIQQQSIIFSGL